MLRKSFVPPTLTIEDPPGPRALERLVEHLGGTGRRRLLEASAAGLRRGWIDTVAAFLDPSSPESRELAPHLPRTTGLSSEGCRAGLDAVLGGVGGEAATEIFHRAEAAGPASDGAPVLVTLASNLPALAVQPWLPALALRRPLILKSPSAEPLFAPAFARTLARRLPAVADATAALSWRGGDEALEAPLLAGCARVLAYGEEATIRDLEKRAPGKVVGYGPKLSLAAVAAGADSSQVARKLARDIALFDQRGCLSVQAVYTTGEPQSLARELARGLAELATSWPPGPAPPALLAAVQQLRAEAAMRGLFCLELEAAAGTVVVEDDPRLRPSPGLRTVRIHTLRRLGDLPDLLRPWRDRLQGVALAGEEAWALEAALRDLGASWLAPPGELQSPDASWHNGGTHPLDLLRRC